MISIYANKLIIDNPDMHVIYKRLISEVYIKKGKINKVEYQSTNKTTNELKIDTEICFAFM